MATFTFNGTTSQTVAFDPAGDRLVLNLNAAEIAGVSEDARTNSISFVATSGAVITLTGVNFSQLQEGNIIAGLASDIELAFGTSGSDADLDGNVVIGLGGTDTLTASSDDAILLGNQGNDILSNGESDNVRMYGGLDADVLTLTATDSSATDASLLVGGLGLDDITVTGGYAGSVTVFGGNEAGDPSDSADDINVDLAETGSAVIYGNGGDDQITVSGGGSASVYGGQGDDFILASITGGEIYGNLGEDAIIVDTTGADGVQIYGNQGDDFIVVGASEGGIGGFDTAAAGENIGVFGGQDDDTILGVVGEGSVVYGGLGADSIGAATEGAIFGGEEDGETFLVPLAVVGEDVSIFGGNGVGDADDGDDVIAVDVLTGGSAEIYGNAGDDIIIHGGAGDRVIFGGAGDDTIALGDGSANFTVTGGIGADIFVSTVRDGDNAPETVETAEDVGFITDVAFGEDKFDFGITVDETVDLVNFTPVAGAQTDAFEAIEDADTLSDAANAAIEFASDATLVDADYDVGAFVFSWKGESYLTVDASANNVDDVASNDGIVRITGFSGEIGTTDFTTGTDVPAGFAGL